MPTILSLSAFLQSMQESPESELEARRIYEGKCTTLMFEDLLRNAKVHTIFIKNVALKLSSRTLAAPAVCETQEASDDDGQETPQSEQSTTAMNSSEVQQKFSATTVFSFSSCCSSQRNRQNPCESWQHETKTARV